MLDKNTTYIYQQTNEDNSALHEFIGRDTQ